MVNLTNYPKPGTALDNKIARNIIERFRERYLEKGSIEKSKGNRRPGWCYLRKDIPLCPSKQSIFNEQLFQSINPYYIYFESARSVHTSDPSSIKLYFDNKPPWIEQDVYIFPPMMEWCIICTHDSDIFVVGDFPNLFPHASSPLKSDE